MQKRNNAYEKLIKEAMALPKRDPRPVPKRDQSLWNRLSAKHNLKAVTKTAVGSVYNIIVSATFGSRTLEERVPVDRLHRHMALHLNRLVAVAMIQDGQLPMNIYVVDRFLSHIDFGNGRVISLRVQLHHQPYRVNPTLASFVVEESKDLHPHEHLFEHFEFDLVDRVPVVTNGGGSTKGRKGR